MIIDNHEELDSVRDGAVLMETDGSLRVAFRRGGKISVWHLSDEYDYVLSFPLLDTGLTLGQSPLGIDKES